jgi:hypothetical protein
MNWRRLRSDMGSLSLSVGLDARGRVKSIEGGTPDPAAVADATR